MVNVETEDTQSEDLGSASSGHGRDFAIANRGWPELQNWEKNIKFSYYLRILMILLDYYDL